ncbi:hypothetical protein GGR56DRAFT_617226 [Xylariaceae sp. FL0804]|nr:hypothetical protein GGR56DRAFT_617226 [Xylariaceae sp. FL0804]
MRGHVFDIRKGQVMKVFVLSHTSTVHHLVLPHHHIAMDDISWLLSFRYLDQAYSMLALKLPAPA